MADFGQTAGFDDHADGYETPVRLVVAPAAGIFQPTVSADNVGGALSVEIGQVLGTIVNNLGTTEVKSAFGGRLMGLLALGGQRLRAGDAVAWLSIATP